MIPKTIHYFWFSGDEKPPLIQKCIDSWKKYCPDYKFVEWNANNFDVHQNEFCSEAYNCKKWAFLTDFARLKVLYDCGGIYMDTDVELIKPLDDFLENRSFIGFEQDYAFGPHLIGAEINVPWIKTAYEHYQDIHFQLPDGTLNQIELPCIVTPIICEQHPNIRMDNSYQINKDSLSAYPKTYFTPKSSGTRQLVLSKDTHAIHHFNGAWLDERYVAANKYIDDKLAAGSGIINILKKSRIAMVSYRMLVRIKFSIEYHEVHDEIKSFLDIIYKNLKLLSLRFVKK